MKLDNIQVKIETKYIYEVTSNTDKIEGRGNQYTIGFFIDRNIAQAVVDRDQFFNRMDTKTRDVIVFYKNGVLDKIHLIGELVDLNTKDPEVLRKEALAKLTPEERKVLGV